MTSIGTQQRYRVHPSFLTYGTESDIDPTDSEQLLLPCLFPGALLGWSFTLSEGLTTQCDGVFTFSVCQEAEVAYSYKARGQDMKQEPSDELLRLEGHGFLAVLVCIIPP